MRILIVKLSAFGDVIHALPLATALKERFPDATIGWLAERRTAVLPRMCAAVDEVLEVDTRAYRRQVFRSLLGPLCRDLARVRNFGADVAIDAQGNLKSGLMTWISGAPRRIGFGEMHLRESINAAFTNEHVEGPFDDEHIVRRNLELLQPLLDHRGLPISFGLNVPETTFDTIDTFLRSVPTSSPRVLLHPGAAWASKRMPLDHWSRLAERLHKDGLQALLAWAPGEEETANALKARLGDRLIVPPKTSFTELAALISRCDLFIGPDTGPMHLAAALGVRCVAFFGPTRPERNGPWGDQHRVVVWPSEDGPRHQREWRDPAAYWSHVDTDELATAARALLADVPR